ncbi:hypothetical protein PHMEG_00012625 [Phytophthora megakarya]|uniref:Uncharacterized protein n=1 Tax=Phytophthora megakarya TaxID=4795 RepID=A0A225W9S8_9STRA|nr:hypothetical protein PHMEG_00012625 [Phytophthora megakarya]
MLLSKWTQEEESFTHLGIVEVESFLLNKDREVVPRVIERFMRRIYDMKRHPDPSKVLIEDVLQVWLDPSILRAAVKHINANLDDNDTTLVNEIKQFLLVVP